MRKTYSEESWREFEEVLTAQYSDVEVEGIRKALTGLEVPFAPKDLQKNIDGKKEYFVEVEELAKKRKVSQILTDLYEIGVIGNYGANPRFSFKGENDIDPMMPLTIHYPLLRFFKASMPAKRRC